MKRPVFIVGCPRSGTTLLYSMLLAAGGFVVYRKETHFYELVPRFGELTTPEAQERFLRLFLQGYLGKVPEVDVERFARAAGRECGRAIDFLPTLMEGLARAQHVDRWMEGTPTHVLYIDRIKEAVPDALFVHVIRDGRDCALSHDRQGWIASFPWDRKRSVGVAALYWEWAVRTGRAMGQAHAQDYYEVRFEDLIADPRATLNRIGAFLDHDLDYDRIVNNPVHALRRPNTSFREERARGSFNPVGRWKDETSAAAVRMCEMLVGSCLEELGYRRACPTASGVDLLRARVMRLLYMQHFTAKHWLKTRTPAGRLAIDTSVWARQPRATEGPFFAPAKPAPRTPCAAPDLDSAHRRAST